MPYMRHVLEKPSSQAHLVRMTHLWMSPGQKVLQRQFRDQKQETILQ